MRAALISRPKVSLPSWGSQGGDEELVILLLPLINLLADQSDNFCRVEGESG
jgi:hypothetical protein